MLKAKTKIGFGIAIAILVSIGMAVRSDPLTGIAYFFILTVLLWAIAKSRHWI